jgi:hypothetical protein
MKTERSIVWSSCDEPGFEHLRLMQEADRITADGIVLKVCKDNAFRVQYGIHCDENWGLREVTVKLLDDESLNIKLSTDGNGHWTNESGQPVFSLNGCYGVDISATPFTNTLAIRQLDLKPGESAELVVVFIAVPEMAVEPSRQRYTCQELNDDGGLYRYEDEGLFKGFTADLRVDREGLVLDYPKLFKRVRLP